MSKTTTPGQYEKLAEMLESKRDIAQGFQKRPKEEVQAFWEEVARTLNALGPPRKDCTAWKKVWIDWKCYIKRKLSSNKKEMMGTGGGQCKIQRISPLEEKVIGLTGLETCTSGVRGAQDFGGRVAVENEQLSEMDISNRSFDDNLPSTSRASSQPRERRAVKETTSSLLQEQLYIQSEFYTNATKFHENSLNKMDKMCTYLRRMNQSLESLAETAAKQFKEQQRHNRIKEELLQRKIEIKMKMLQLEHPDYEGNN
ncbi:uncharacterized protein [Eurosta solidaginis]|uniref:uncharacterized protein n=1 Tax=Eurosta solidaginis TaxID=178769 RepID=UPI0035312F6D